MTDSQFLPTFAGWLVALGEDVLSLANLLESPEVRSPWRRMSAEALESLLRASELIPDGLESLGYLEQAFIFRLLARRSLEGGGASDSYVAELGVDGFEPAAEAFDGNPDAAWSVSADAGASEPALEARSDEPAFETDATSQPGDEPALEEGQVLDEAPLDEAPEASPEGGAPEASLEGDAPASAAFDAAEAEPPAAPLGADDAVPARVARLAADAPLVEELIGADLPALEEMAFAEVRRGRRARELLVDAAARDEVLREARAWVESYRAPELSDAPEELVKIRSFFRTRLLRAS